LQSRRHGILGGGRRFFGKMILPRPKKEWGYSQPVAAAEVKMDAFFSHEDAYIVLAFLALALPAATAVVAYFWFKVRREEVQAGLKRAMIERGLSAEEIRIVIEAGAAEVPEGSAAMPAAGQRA
jgi:hypothetical protein